jgi:hypothetical protein
MVVRRMGIEDVVEMRNGLQDTLALVLTLEAC